MFRRIYRIYIGNVAKGDTAKIKYLMVEIIYLILYNLNNINYDCNLEYKGKSCIPSKITITSGKEVFR